MEDPETLLPCVIPVALEQVPSVQNGGVNSISLIEQRFSPVPTEVQLQGMPHPPPQLQSHPPLHSPNELLSQSPTTPPSTHQRSPRQISQRGGPQPTTPSDSATQKRATSTPTRDEQPDSKASKPAREHPVRSRARDPDAWVPSSTGGWITVEGGGGSDGGMDSGLWVSDDGPWWGTAHGLHMRGMRTSLSSRGVWLDGLQANGTRELPSIPPSIQRCSIVSAGVETGLPKGGNVCFPRTSTLTPTGISEGSISHRTFVFSNLQAQN